jgi:ribosomal protein S18 acetylase RimI-like enzyme
VDFHVGDLAWWNREPEQPVRLWREGGEAVAWGWLFAPREVEIAVDPQHPELLEEALDWFEAESEASILETAALDADAAKIEALERRGYRARRGPFFLHLERDLRDLQHPELPDSYRLSQVRRTVDIQKRVRVQRAAFPSTLTEEKYRRLVETWPYRADLDVVVEDREAAFVAFCLAWLDDANSVGELEPVGTDPAHSRRGLARAACLEALARLRKLGATRAIVYARGDAGYPAPLRLYRSLGFKATGRRIRFARSR